MPLATPSPFLRADVNPEPFTSSHRVVFGVYSVSDNRSRRESPPMSRPEITTPEVLSDESVVELSLRPQRLEEFIGQQKVKDALRIYIDAALGRREPLDH